MDSDQNLCGSLEYVDRILDVLSIKEDKKQDLVAKIFGPQSLEHMIYKTTIGTGPSRGELARALSRSLPLRNLPKEALPLLEDLTRIDPLYLSVENLAALPLPFMLNASPDFKEACTVRAFDIFQWTKSLKGEREREEVLSRYLFMYASEPDMSERIVSTLVETRIMKAWQIEAVLRILGPNLSPHTALSLDLARTIRPNTVATGVESFSVTTTTQGERSR